MRGDNFFTNCLYFDQSNYDMAKVTNKLLLTFLFTYPKETLLFQHIGFLLLTVSALLEITATFIQS